MKNIIKLVLGTTTLIAASTITAKVAGDTFLHGLPTPPTRGITEYDEAMEKIAHVQAFEQTQPLQDICHTTVLTHGHKVEQVIVLMHGMTSCPRQFIEFGNLLFEQGYNVLIPRMPYNGYRDRDTPDLKYITMKDLRDCSATMVDIAHGLGEHVTYTGLSVGGTMAAWVAQYRADVDRAILIAPAFTVDRHLGIGVSKLLMYLLYLLPNLMTQWFSKGHGSPFGYRGFATRSLAVMMRFGFSVYQAALKQKPAVQSVLIVSNAADPSMNNAIIRSLVQRWQKRGLQYCETYEFDASQHLPHDIIGTLNPQQHVSIVYPVLLDLITRKQHSEATDTHKPLTEEQLQAAHVGQLEQHNSTIHLADYDPNWPQLFEREAKRIRAVLRDQIVLLEHVGSTSIPGLSAKPKIDILLVVKDSSDESAYVPALEATGYTLHIREPEWHQHRLFKGPDTDINLHVFSVGSSEIERMLLFRDYLRNNSAELELYQSTKLELAKRNWKYVQNYADAKSKVVEGILIRAREAQLGNKPNRAK